MNSKNTISTVVISFMSIMIMTLVTHYIITQSPDTITKNIDIAAPIKLTDVNAFDATGVTPLMQAAIDSDVERTKILIENGADPNIRSANSDLDYALNFALINGGKIGSLGVAQLLLAKGADVNVANARGMAPIHAMMQITQPDNRKQILRDLMDHGANINVQNEDGSTMLHITVSMNDWDWVAHLNKEYGQIINYAIRDKKGRTPLDLAKVLGHVSVPGTDSVENELRKRPRYIGDDYDVATTDSHGRNGLELAVMRSDMRYVQELIAHGANLAHQDNMGNTALHYAVINPDQSYLRYLLSKNAPVAIANRNGELPIFWVIRIGSIMKRYEVAKLLIVAGSPLTTKNNSGKTFLDVALARGDLQLAGLIKSSLLARKKS